MSAASAAADDADDAENAARGVGAADAGGGVEPDINADIDADIDAQVRLALQTLAELDAGNGVSLPRLAKRTGLRVSVLLRLYTLMSDARVGADRGPGWVELRVDEDGRWIARMTPAGRGEPQAPPP